MFETFFHTGIFYFLIRNVTKGLINLNQKPRSWGFPGGPVVKNPPANAGDTGSSPGPRIPHAAEQLSLCATTTEPAL